MAQKGDDPYEGHDEKTSLLFLQRLHSAGIVENDQIKTCETTTEGFAPPPMSLVIAIVGNVEDSIKFDAGFYFATIFSNSGTFALNVGFQNASKDAFSAVTGVHRWRLESEFQMSLPFMENRTTLRQSYECFRREVGIHFSKTHPRGVWLERWLSRTYALDTSLPYRKLFIVTDASDEREIELIRILPSSVIVSIGQDLPLVHDLHFDTLESLKTYGMPLLADLLGRRF
jgi:hypothetical protein